MSKFEPVEENPEADPSEVTENWDCYVFSTEDGPVLNMLNLDARPARENELATRCLVRIHLADPSEHGFATPSEDQVLWQIEDALVQLMHQTRGGRYVGRSTHAGMRVFCYYMRESDCPPGEEVAQALAPFEAYTPEMNLTEDAEWEYYFEFLYPSPEMLRCMRNHKLIHVLAENGDRHEVPREIDHWIYFQSEENRDRYKSAVTLLGFMVRDEGETDDGIHSLRIYREDPIDIDGIDETVLILFHLAEEHEGEYDGWETPVVKDEDEE